MRWARAIAVCAALAAGCATGPQVTTQRIRHPNGQVRWEVTMRDGVPHGESRTFDANGTMRSAGAYHLGLRHGLFRYYDVNQDLIGRTYFWRGEVIWKSQRPDERPPRDLYDRIRRAEAAARVQQEVDRGPSLIDRTPAPYFASLDRTVKLTRLGADVGVGGAAPDGGFVTRGALFGNYVLGPASVYGQLSGARATTMDDSTQGGRTTAELSGAYHLETRPGVLSPRLGVVVPIANDDQDGAEAAAGVAYQRPADAVASLGSTVAVRTGASYTASSRRWVAQADAGVDWAAGGAEATVRPIGRVNAAVGYGGALLGLLELSNAVRLDDAEQRIHALGAGAAFRTERIWTTVLVSRTSGDHTTVVIGGGYGF